MFRYIWLVIISNWYWFNVTELTKSRSVFNTYLTFNIIVFHPLYMVRIFKYLKKRLHKIKFFTFKRNDKYFQYTSEAERVRIMFVIRTVKKEWVYLIIQNNNKTLHLFHVVILVSPFSFHRDLISYGWLNFI